MTGKINKNDEDIYTPTPEIGVIKDKYIITNTQRKFQEFSDLTHNLFRTLNGYEGQQGLKNTIKNIESLFENRGMISQKHGLGGMQATLHDLNERRAPIIHYIKNLPPKLNKKHLGQLLDLRTIYTTTKDSIIFCYHMEDKIQIIEKRQKQSENDRQKYIDTLPAKNSLANLGNALDDDISRSPIDEFRKEFIKIVDEHYVFNEQGIPYLKSWTIPYQDRGKNLKQTTEILKEHKTKEEEEKRKAKKAAKDERRRKNKEIRNKQK